MSPAAAAWFLFVLGIMLAWLSFMPTSAMRPWMRWVLRIVAAAHVAPGLLYVWALAMALR